MAVTAAPPAIPIVGREQIEELTGTPATWEMTTRAGAAVWRVTGPSGLWAVKSGSGEYARVIAREASVLQWMSTAVPAVGYAVGARSGQDESGAWLATPWLHGDSTWERFHSVRFGNSPFDAAHAAAVDLCRAVGALHQTGWVHGDLQPHHAIHAPGGVRFVECAWAWPMWCPPPGVFQAGLVHLMSPELIRRIETGQPVATTPADEVYALAAGLWWAASSTWPLDYEAADIDPAECTAVELRRLRLVKHVPFVKLAQWPELGEVLGNVLSAGERERPTALQLAALLEGLRPRRSRAIVKRGQMRGA